MVSRRNGWRACETCWSATFNAGYVPGAVAVVARRRVHIEATGYLAFEGAGAGTPMAADTTRADAIRWALARIRERPAYERLRERIHEIDQLRTDSEGSSIGFGVLHFFRDTDRRPDSSALSDLR